MDHLLTIREMVSETALGEMDLVMKETGKMISDTVTASLHMKKKPTLVNGKWI